MRDGVRLWRKDQKEMWRFIRRHPFIFVGYMVIAITIMKWLGL